MAIVILADQKRSRSRSDLVSKWSGRLNREYKNRIVLPFTRTSGDEMQAVLGDGSVGGIVREMLVSDQWWIGFGLGTVETPLPEDTREGRGPAFWLAREAIEMAKSQRATRPLAVLDGGDGEAAVRLEECLAALAYVINRRSPSQQTTAREYSKTGGSIREIAKRLSISVQGARKNVIAAGCEEESGLVSLADWIARPATEF